MSNRPHRLVFEKELFRCGFILLNNINKSSLKRYQETRRKIFSHHSSSSVVLLTKHFTVFKYLHFYSPHYNMKITFSDVLTWVSTFIKLRTKMLSQWKEGQKVKKKGAFSLTDCNLVCKSHLHDQIGF